MVSRNGPLLPFDWREAKIYASVLIHAFRRIWSIDIQLRSVFFRPRLNNHRFRYLMFISDTKKPEMKRVRVKRATTR